MIPPGIGPLTRPPASPTRARLHRSRHLSASVCCVEVCGAAVCGAGVRCAEVCGATTVRVGDGDGDDGEGGDGDGDDGEGGEGEGDDGEGVDGEGVDGGGANPTSGIFKSILMKFLAFSSMLLIQLQRHEFSSSAGSWSNWIGHRQRRHGSCLEIGLHWFIHWTRHPQHVRSHGHVLPRVIPWIRLPSSQEGGDGDGADGEVGEGDGDDGEGGDGDGNDGDGGDGRVRKATD